MTLSIRSKQLRGALCVTALTLMLAACGGGDSGTTHTNSNDNPPPGDNGNPPTTAQIQGIATPSSVSVVTATNAN